MGFSSAVGTCFKKYFVFNGRAQRSEFWWWALFVIGVSIPLSILDVLIFEGTVEELSPLDTTFTLFTLIPWVTVSARRLHDIDQSGWWQLLPLLPMILVGIGIGLTLTNELTGMVLIVVGAIATFATFILLIVWWAKDGHKNDNRFGSSPKYGGQASAFD